MTRSDRPCLLAALAISLTAGFAAAAAEPISAQKEWAAFVEDGDNGRHCFAGTVPTKDGVVEKGLRRDPAYLTVSFWPELDRFQEVSVTAGFPLRKGAALSVTVDIGKKGKKTFDLISRGERAWTTGPGQDADLVAAMREGGSMSVRSTSVKNNEIVDEYSLWGFTKMLQAASEACEKQ